ncbi:MAG: UPF0179 family protein [Nitrososphaeria archaeon]
MRQSLASYENKIKITLLGSNVAKKGYRFMYEHTNNNICLQCYLKKVCIDNIEKNRIYEVVNVRDKKHICKLLNSYVSVVEVKISPIEVFANIKMAVEDLVTTYIPVNCDKFNCKNFVYCKPIGLFENDKIKIKKIMERTYCPKGYNLIKLLVIPLI